MNILRKIESRFAHLSDDDVALAHSWKAMASSPNGKKCMADLTDLVTPPMGARFQPGENSEEAAFRDGAAVVLNYIEAQVALAKQKPKTKDSI